MFLDAKGCQTHHEETKGCVPEAVGSYLSLTVPARRCEARVDSRGIIKSRQSLHWACLTLLIHSYILRVWNLLGLWGFFFMSKRALRCTCSAAAPPIIINHQKFLFDKFSRSPRFVWCLMAAPSLHPLPRFSLLSSLPFPLFAWYFCTSLCASSHLLLRASRPKHAWEGRAGGQRGLPKSNCQN